MIHHLSSALPSSGIESSSSSIGVKESTTLRLVVCPRKTKEEGDQKSTGVRRYDIYFTIPQVEQVRELCIVGERLN